MRFKKREVLKRFRITEYTLEQWIGRGILERGIRLTENSHPFWTQSQIDKADQKLLEIVNVSPVEATPNKAPRPMRPFSAKLSARIHAGGGRVRL